MNLSEDVLVEAFEFLDRLREIGSVNMYGSAPYVEENFKLTRQESKEVVSGWMSTFDDVSDAQTRAAKALTG